MRGRVVLRTYTGNLEVNTRQARVTRHIQGFTVGIAESKVREILRSQNGSQVLAVRRYDPESTRACAVDVAPIIHLHAIRSTMSFVGVHIHEYLTVGNRIVRLNVKPQDALFGRINDV